MNGNCHFLFGAAVGLALAGCIDIINVHLPHLTSSAAMDTLFIMGGMFGGLFPDIDSKTSHIGQLTAPFSSLVGKRGAQHRRLLHDPAVYVLGAILSYMLCPALCGFFAGCLSHLWLDAWNPAGLPVLFGRKRIRLGRMKSGGIASVLFTWLNIAAVFVLAFLVRRLL